MWALIILSGVVVQITSTAFQVGDGMWIETLIMPTQLALSLRRVHPNARHDRSMPAEVSDTSMLLTVGIILPVAIPMGRVRAMADTH